MTEIIQVFDWTSPDGKQSIKFNATEMLRAVKRGELKHSCVLVHLDRKWVEEWVLPHSIDPQGMEYIKTMTEAQMSKPILAVEMADHGVLVIDGRHRYVARYLANKPYVTMMVVYHPRWHRYAIFTPPLNSAPPQQ